MSKHRCPCCGRKGWKVSRESWQAAKDLIVDAVAVANLRKRIKAELWGDKKPPAPEEERTPDSSAQRAKTPRRWARGRLRDKAGEDLRQQIKQELWGDKPPPKPGFKEMAVQPHKGPPTREQLATADGLRQQWQQRDEKRKLKQRLYYRNYYHKNKAHIDAMRKKRLAARSNGA